MAEFAYRNMPTNPQAAAASAAVIPTAAQLNQQFTQPTATPDQMERMSYEDTIAKVVGAFAVLLVGAAVGWFVPALWIPAAVVGLVLGLVNAFKKQPSPALILIYSGVQGVFVGGISAFYASLWDGIIPSAVLGTLGVVAVTLALFASGKVRASKRATKIFLVAMVGYLAFSLINVGLMVFGVTDSMFGARDFTILGIPLGVILGIFVVIMAAYSLVLDFDFIKRGIDSGAPRVYGWTGAFGIIATVVWLYLEILRLLMKLQSRD